MKSGIGIMIYATGQSIPEKTTFYSVDGELLIVPPRGNLHSKTELGHPMSEAQRVLSQSAWYA